MVIPGKGNDVSQRTCEIDGCNRAHAARGMCASHYGSWHRRINGRKDLVYTKTCVMCGNEWTTRRNAAKFCSDSCKGRHYSETMQTRCRLPVDHPVMILIAESRKAKRTKPSRPTFEWRTERECPGCACLFTPLFTPNMICCSKRCFRRVARWRRNAAECEATGTFTWSEFMRIARRFDYRCAYCAGRDGQLDPDHVVPLSRGGSNSTTNLLPSCRQCNGDKRDLLLDEWAIDREARGKAPRITNWAPEDRRYWHLTSVSPISLAA